ncbi:MAG: hypothetical protein ACJ76N_24780 [Thermoanaerobaculia bacterium]
MDETGRWASLREVRHPDVRGWTVVGADGRKLGRVRFLLADPHDDESRFFAVELDQTALQQDLDTPGGAERITAGADPNRPGSRPLADADPTVGESERTADLNAGARQHAADFTGAVPRDDDGREGGSARIEPLHVLIPFRAGRLKETDEQVVLTSLREADVARLPAFQPA